MPIYTTSSAATALGVPPKWIDNLLSHNKIDGVQQAGQGVSRRLSIESVMVIAVTRTFMESLHVPAGYAIEMAERLIVSPPGGVALSPAISVTVDLVGLQQSLLRGLAHAVEVTPHPPRGRPAGG